MSLPIDMATIPADTYQVGCDRCYPDGSVRCYPEESPARQVKIESFRIDLAPVTNKDFSTFVEQTGHLTVSELPPDPKQYPDLTPEESIPESLVFQPPPKNVDRSNPLAWWELVAGADWRHPQGPTSNIAGLDDHPVVHVAYSDAEAYAKWAGKRLPSAEEWEVAARGGLVDAQYAWGNELKPNNRWMANIWQGAFPWTNEEEDGWFWTSPVGTFPANGYGLVDVCGNVWEWTKSAYLPTPTPGEQERRIIKGGSFLCAENYCVRYRPSALQGQTLDTATCHMGFRCAQNIS